jgi:hypothetical protein
MVALSCRRRRLATIALLATGGARVFADESSSPSLRLQDNGEEVERMNAEQFHRHLEATSAETFDHWQKGNRANLAIPLDLTLSSVESDGSAYLAGHGGYAEFFVHGEQDNGTTADANDQNEPVRSRYLEANIPLNDVWKGSTTSAWRGHKLEQTTSKGLRGQRHHKKNGIGARQLREHDIISLDSIKLRDAAVADHHGDADVRNLEVSSTFPGRELSRKDRNKMNKETDTTDSDKKKGRGKNTGNIKKDRKRKKLPNIADYSPSDESGIRDSQTFTVVAEPSPATHSPITTVLFQITDFNGKSSAWIEVPEVATDKYQISIDGFRKHKGTKWTYQMLVQDASGKKSTTGAITVIVNGIGDDNDNFVDDAEMTPPAPAQEMRQQLVTDKNWPYGGNIQFATGKILFEFRGQGDFVCSGTLVMDGNNGLSPNKSNGRSIIQTAAHCVYNDVLKEFATKAMFIPDQVSTKGEVSNTDCNDDKLGCWKLSFGVVASGWAEATFPDNVAYDYAYYVVHDNPATHSGGYLRGLTGILDHDIDAVKLDFDYRSQDFTFALGYSSEHDPNFRYCSMDQSTIYGVSWYENLWLDRCGLGGGASGGGWIYGMDDNGVGTLYSVNSWGFDDKTGMAGPSLNTRHGSHAECLFQKALTADDPGREGGYVVNC